MKVRIRKDILIIKLPLINPPRKSKSGKTLIVATSFGSKRTSARVNGKPVVANCTAYVRPDGYERKEKAPRKKTRPSARQIRRSPKR